MSFPILHIINSFHLLLLFIFCPVCLSVKETAEIETGMAEMSSWDQANIRQKLGLVWVNRKKISQIIKDYFYLQFFLLIILWYHPKPDNTRPWKWEAWTRFTERLPTDMTVYLPKFGLYYRV